jgi:hypothetical protein
VRPARRCTLLSGALRNASRTHGLELQQQLAQERDANHVHHRLRRRANDHSGDEGRCDRVHDEAVPGRVLPDAIGHALERSRATLQQESEMQQLRSRYASLSPREVMALVVCGLLNRHVGGELRNNEVTVKAHRGHQSHCCCCTGAAGTSRKRSRTVPGMPSRVSAPSCLSNAAVSGHSWNWNDCFEPSARR